jgi:hypothetical protein
VVVNRAAGGAARATAGARSRAAANGSCQEVWRSATVPTTQKSVGVVALLLCGRETTQFSSPVGAAGM